MTFEGFFERATGNTPYAYQTIIAIEGAQMPSIVSVPTGLGKTAATILGWLWRRRFADEKVRTQTPRRLIYCLPMRVLVEQTRANARNWLRKLDLIAENAPTEHPADKVAVHVLMGGDLEVDWDHWPEREQILIGTQDMLLSRALNRGYAMSRFRWPVHYGLLNSDCLWVMDEVQLMGNGLATSAQLQAFRRKFGAVGVTRSVWMSATMRDDWLKTVDIELAKDAPGTLPITKADKGSKAFCDRFDAKKRLEKSRFDASQDGKDEAELALNRHSERTRTLVVVNTVKRAQAVYAALRKKKPGAALVLVHSRFRPVDRKAQMDRLLAEPGETGTIAVCTQVVEAGVDVSARALITDLAPWASMVQRFGRCNRNGEFNASRDATVIWIAPENLDDDKKLKAAPYTGNDLRASRKRLEQLADVGPVNLPAVEDAMPYTHVVRRKDLVELFDTTPDLAGADIDISRFIRETDDHDVQVFWRAIPEREDPVRNEPTAGHDELCSVTVGDFRAWLEKKGKRRTAWRWDHIERKWDTVKRNTLYPGLVLMVRSYDGGYDTESGWTGEEGAAVPLTGVMRQGDANDRDPDTEHRDWSTIAGHTDRVVAVGTDLLDALRPSLEAWRLVVLEAARWHDAGKAHAVFQNAIPSGAPSEYSVWAKALPKMKRYERPGFRHELATAVAMLSNDKSDLAAYLAAAHHGKVRLSIRSLPHEKMPPGDPERRFARGIWDGDVIPETDLGGGVAIPTTTIALTYMELGEDEVTGASWLARMLSLRDSPDLGPFRLAFLESILRVADWRGSGAAVRNAVEEVAS